MLTRRKVELFTICTSNIVIVLQGASSLSTKNSIVFTGAKFAVIIHQIREGIKTFNDPWTSVKSSNSASSCHTLSSEIVAFIRPLIPFSLRAKTCCSLCGSSDNRVEVTLGRDLVNTSPHLTGNKRLSAITSTFKIGRNISSTGNQS